MKPFCETVVKQVLPAVRSLLAKRLDERGLKNKEIAAAMGITPAAVTQYLKKARGTKTKVLMKNKAVNSLVVELADKMAEKRLSPAEGMAGFCGICKEVRRQRILCEIHSGPAGCTICMP